MKSTIAALGKAFDLVLDALAVIAAILLALVMVFVSISVISRYFFGNPMAWVIEVSEYTLLYSTFLGAAWLLRQEGHTRVDIVLNLLNPRQRAALNTFTSVLGVGACLALLWYSSVTTLGIYQRGQLLMKIFEVPKFVPLLIIPFGSFFLVIQFARRAVAYYSEFRSTARPQPGLQSEPAAELHHLY